MADERRVTEVLMEVEYHTSEARVTEVEQEVEEHQDDVQTTSLFQGTEWNREDVVVTSIMQLTEFTEGAPPILPPPAPGMCPPFRLFLQDCEIRVKDWGSPGGYRVVKAFGGHHQTPPTGADI